MQALAGFITKIVDFFYEKTVLIIPRSEKIISRQFFRYGACGGGNMVLDWVLYFIIYNFAVGHNIVYITLPVSWLNEIVSSSAFYISPVIAVSPHIAALCIVFPITLFTGFWLNKYVTFTGSSLRGRKQLFRYVMIVAVNLAINYFGLKLLVDVCGIYPTPSKMIITVVTVAVSYFGQKYFSFKR